MSPQQILTAVAAALGGAAWVSVVGSGVVALRLRQADLPIEPVVALMSPEHRFAIGAGTLALPLFAGFIGFVVDWVLGPKGPGLLDDGSRQGRAKDHRRPRRAVVTVLVGGGLLYFVQKPPFHTFAFAGGAVALAALGAFEALPKTKLDAHGFDERVAVFLVVLVAAGIGALVAQSFGSPSFDEAEITLRDNPAAVTGGYITSTDQTVVVSPRCEVIEAVPRDRIERIRVGPGEVRRTHC